MLLGTVWIVLGMSATGCGLPPQVVSLSCTTPAEYCVTSVEMDNPVIPGRLEFDETPSAFAIRLRGTNVGVEHLSPADGATIVSDFRLRGTRLFLQNGGPDSWVPIRITSDPDELANEYAFNFGGDVEAVEIWHRYPGSYPAVRTVSANIIIDDPLEGSSVVESVEAGLAFWDIELRDITITRAEVDFSEGFELDPVAGTRPPLTVVVVDGFDGIFDDEFETEPLGIAAVGAPASRRGYLAYVPTRSSNTEHNIATDSRVIAHEIGHLAGLLHTNDQSGADFLDDTPRCESPAASGCDNIMGVGAGGTTSPMQRQIVRNSLLLDADIPVDQLLSSDEGPIAEHHAIACSLQHPGDFRAR